MLPKTRPIFNSFVDKALLLIVYSVPVKVSIIGDIELLSHLDGLEN